MAEIVSTLALAFCRGRADYRRGEACPAKDFDENGPTNEKMALWLGWMVERGVEIMDAEELRRWAEEGEPLPRRLRAAPTQRPEPVSQRPPPPPASPARRRE